MTRFLLIGALLLCGCESQAPRMAQWRVGNEVTVKADGRQGVVTHSYASTTHQGETEYLVKIKRQKPKRGQVYDVEGFRYDELTKTEQ